MNRFIFALVLSCAPVALADDVPTGADGKPLFGHSSHGDAFDEGPRQAAVLLPGMGEVHFAVTTKNPEAQRFFDQGVAQLHGFWYYEAERSFRQAVKLDGDCAMAYWGLAMANVNNGKRAGEFIKEAGKRKEKAGANERAWIEAYEAFFKDGKAPSADSRKALVKALERLVFEYPDDAEAKAFLMFQLWDNSQKGIPLNSHTVLDALGRLVLEKNPRHPGVHHYLIHLWNHEDDRRALKSAGVLGQSAPGIAHMWHMPGHTFTKLRRYADSAWQQEASARTDHAHMALARILPEQIHNYAHNNDWLVENLGFIGRVRDALDLAKNMIELPRPARKAAGGDKGKNGSQMGASRLRAALLAWEHWDEILALDETQYLERSDDPVDDAKRLSALAVASFSTGNKPKGDEKVAAVEYLIRTAKEKRRADGEAAENEAKKAGKTKEQAAAAGAEASKKADGSIGKLEEVLAVVQLYQAIAEEKTLVELKPLLDKSGSIEITRRSRIYLKAGDSKKALELAGRAVKEGEGQVLPLANLADIQWRDGKQEDAKKTFALLRPLCAQADIGEVAFSRLRPVADALALPADWRPRLDWPADTGTRPELAKLGPFRWQPYQAPAWEALDQNKKLHSLAEHSGKPLMIVFYLGSGCSHCIEQLNLLAPLAKDYEAAGINIIAVSADDAEDLNKTFVQAKDAAGFHFPIVADPALAVFKAYRAFDDFENQPLHGMFLIDGAGYVRWQDVSFKPFGELTWLLGESKRLLAMPVTAQQGVASTVKK